MEILRKKEMLEMKNAIIEIKDGFDRFINRLNTVEERMSEHEDMMKETPQT